ncbi:hypothetical protein ACO0RG_001577 [Hanseniaspora osmophila]|uniref:Tafazzin family protein n=1 Tax=Hanseniaspora osmophila TaxID=56408 RepID=A0A1E5R1U0_9ASCO|nr:Lysophosphatidylcholine acyltransferase [Hanseniaspora osmophila]
MSFNDVMKRGDDFLAQYPRRSKLWNMLSFTTCMVGVTGTKIFMNLFYKPKVHNIERLESAMTKAVEENRGLMTVMNHMSVVDDPFVWGVLPLRIYTKYHQMRWCLGASNVCFKTPTLAQFFSLGQVLSTERFGKGPFQGSIDAAVRLLSPDDTMDFEYTPASEHTSTPPGNANTHLINKKYIPPVLRDKPAWVHVYPEGFVLQLETPFANSMRYFKWGITRLILESTKPPVIVPMFSTGFEKVAPESAAGTLVERYLPRNFGANIDVSIGHQISEELIDSYRAEWTELCQKYPNKENPNDLSDELKYGKEACALRSKVAAGLRDHVAQIRHKERFFVLEDERFRSPEWWKEYTKTEGKSDPDVQFIGQNWAIRRLQGYKDNLDDKIIIEVPKK